MSLVEEMAKEFVDYKYDSCETPQDFIDLLRSELYRHSSDKNKIDFISKVKNEIRLKYDIHYNDCPNKESCSELKEFNRNIYFLDGLLSEYGINLNNEDNFTENEIRDYSNKLDRIIKDLDEIKKGQGVIYNDLYDEIEELKNLYFLGKKNWKQLLAGKIIDMVAGGIIGETISKELINLTGIITTNLLNNID
jgi:hypothetical protein